MLRNDPSVSRLIKLLAQFGIPAHTVGESRPSHGFPLRLPLSGTGDLVLDLPAPACLAHFDDDEIGFAIVDKSGYTRARWGAALRLEAFEPLESLQEGPWAPLFAQAWRYGQAKTFSEGWRCFAVKVDAEPDPEVFILLANAGAEEAATRRAHLSEKHADALKRIGKALTMHQTMQPLTVAAVHAINSALDLASVLLWVRPAEDRPLVLTASVGANRLGTAALAELHLDDGITCAAELAANTMQPLFLNRVDESSMTTDLEAKICYLKPGGLMAIPLTAGPKLIGVLEVISRDGDDTFRESQELFNTLAEHLALAINSALMFEGLERLASYDPLTGVANHRTLQEFLLRRIQEAERTSTTVGVIMLDVDHFRAFNEEEGHDAGDQVLRMVAEVLKSSVRSYDLAARYGGEEFTLIMPGIGTEGLTNIAERIRKRIEQLIYFNQAGHARHVTASLGCSVYPESARDAATLIKAADVALFEAKRRGRNQVVLSDGTIHPEDDGRQSHTTVARMRVREELADECDRLLAICDPYISQLARHLQLSVPQAAIMRSAVLLAPSWQAAIAANDGDYIQRLRSVGELRAVVACLDAIGQRFDERGGKIPLLARCVAVLMAFVREKGAPFRRDAGRFDPEIVGLVADLSEAA